MPPFIRVSGSDSAASGRARSINPRQRHWPAGRREIERCFSTGDEFESPSAAESLDGPRSASIARSRQSGQSLLWCHSQTPQRAASPPYLYLCQKFEMSIFRGYLGLRSPTAHSRNESGALMDVQPPSARRAIRTIARDLRSSAGGKRPRTR